MIDFDNIKKELKTKFYGIDEQVDKVVDSFKTWLSIKDYQVKPIVTCLWGLTGTGKTDLINQTIKLLSLEGKKFYFKFGPGDIKIENKFRNISNDSKQQIFILDEFQYLRSKNENGEEISNDNKDSINLIWGLLDNGEVMYNAENQFKYENIRLLSSITKIDSLFQYDLQITSQGFYHPQMVSVREKERCYTGDEYESINKSCYAPFFEFLDLHIGDLLCLIRVKEIPNEISISTVQELHRFISNCESLQDIQNFLKTIYSTKFKESKSDFSQSLVFVLGNLDECFTMSNDLNSDLDADYFYKKTKEISIVNIREALLKRFRAEQVARLGSNHVIYPSLSKDAFMKIINSELDKIKKILITLHDKSDFPFVKNVEYSDKIKELIYKEGVMPIIGARSVLSTISLIVTEKLPALFNCLQEIASDKTVSIFFEYNKKIKLFVLVFNKLIIKPH